jgi:hypothetical protein
MPNKIKKPLEAHLINSENLLTFLYILVPKKATRANTADKAKPNKSSHSRFQLPKCLVQSHHHWPPTGDPVDIVGSRLALTSINTWLDNVRGMIM